MTTSALLDLAPPETPAARGPSSAARGKRRYLRGKRGVESGAALVLLVTASPLILVLAAAIEATSRGSAFTAQWRVGRFGRLFRMYSLRTTYRRDEGDCGESGPVWADDDPSLATPVGRALRATRLDGLPALVNVVRGDVSFVGPRAERPLFVRTHARSVPRFAARLAVRPGLTGLAQVRGRRGESPSCVKQRIAWDLVYVRRMSWRLDARIVLASILRPFARDDGQPVR